MVVGIRIVELCFYSIDFVWVHISAWGASVLKEKTKIILVQAPNEAWFLPGGEIEAGEDHYSALERELIEELGFTATLGQYYGQADEYFYSSHRDTYYYNPAYIYEVVDFSKIGKPLEDFNNLAWFPIDEAIAKLKRGSHKWGIEQWKETNTTTDKS